MAQSQERLDSISTWGSADLRCHDVALLPEVCWAGTQNESSSRERVSKCVYERERIRGGG